MRDYTIISSKDSRFPHPIMLDELPNLNCEVSLLVNFEQAKNPYDWEVGKHGIDIKFKDEEGIFHSATYLPEVAEEQGWDQKTTLKHLVRKARYYDKIDNILNNIVTERYQSIKKTISYNEYKNMK